MTQSDADAADCWAQVAVSCLHWYHPTKQQWLTAVEGGGWHGWQAPDFTRIESSPELQYWKPWTVALDASSAPLLRWFAGGTTNAAFNEIDANVLINDDMNATRPTLLSEQPNEPSNTVSLQQLLVESVEAAKLLQSACTGLADRVCIHMINSPAAVCWVAACKRVARPYVAVAAGTPASSLAHRLDDVGATTVLASPNLVHVARAALQQSLLVLPALADDGAAAPRAVPTLFVPASGASGACGCGTLTRVPVVTDGHAEDGGQTTTTTAEEASPICISLDELHSSTFDASDGPTMVRQCARVVCCCAVDAAYPLFVLYTSGSTGKHAPAPLPTQQCF